MTAWVKILRLAINAIVGANTTTTPSIAMGNQISTECTKMKLLTSANIDIVKKSPNEAAIGVAILSAYQIRWHIHSNSFIFFKFLLKKKDFDKKNTYIN